MTTTSPSWIAFAQSTRLASGTPRDVAAAVKTFVDAHPDASVLLFDAISSEPVEIDLRGSLPEVIARLQQPPGTDASSECATPVRVPGRPKLGVTAREVTLLPRHWEWLAGQPGGASVALRKLVEQALRSNSSADRMRTTREATYRFMTAIAGNEAGHEDAVRALFAGDLEKLAALIEPWPVDIRDHVLRLARAGD